MFTGKRALISFLSWLDYCDQLIKEAHKVLMLTHCILKCHVLHADRIKELIFMPESHRRQNYIVFFLHCIPVSSCSFGKTSERKILCVCDGATAHADVSVLSHQSFMLCGSF